MKTTLIIPTLNEAEVIGMVLSQVPLNLLDEVLVVDNGSTDGTADVATRAGARVITETRHGCSPSIILIILVMVTVIDHLSQLLRRRLE